MAGIVGVAAQDEENPMAAVLSGNDELMDTPCGEGQTTDEQPAAHLASNWAGMAVQARIVSDLDAILALREEWQTLEAQCADTALFQSFAWCANFLDFAGEGVSARVITLRKAGQLVGLLPLTIQRKRGLRVLTGLSEPFQQYTDMLIAPDVAPQSLTAPLIEAMRQAGADLVHLGQVREGSALDLVAGSAIPGSGERDGAPFVAIHRHADFKAYQSTLRSKTRKNLRNARNRLEREAPVRHQMARGGQLLKEVVKRAYEGREGWLEDMGITSRAFQDSDFQGFLERFASREGAAGEVEIMAMSLTHGENVLSDQWGFVYRGRYYAFMASWNPKYEDYSPGRLHLGEVIRSCFEEGIATADFLLPASAYKLSWTEDVTPVRDRVLALTFAGWLHARLWLGLLRPLAKQAFFRLPPALRGRLLTLVSGR